MRTKFLFGTACFFWATLAPSIHSGARGEEFVEIILPLEDGRFYSAREFCAQCNRKLGGTYAVGQMGDERLELTPLERAALMLASETGLTKMSLTDDRLTLLIPNQQDEQVRLRQRRRLERLLHIPLTGWPEGKGLHLPDDFNSARRTILLVHGLESGLGDLTRFQAACQNSGIQAATFDYPNDGPLASSGDRLRADLTELSHRYPSLRLAIVAHSMGGLVARHCVEAGMVPACVTQLFMLGTPHRGSNLAGAQPWLELLNSSPAAIALGKDLMRDGLGEAAADLSPDSPFLTALNVRRHPDQVRYYSLIGRQPFISEKQRAGVEHELLALFERRKIPRETRSAILRALRSDEMREGLGDGAVSVSSARLKGVAATGVFELNHQELLDLPGEPPQDSDVFQWIFTKLAPREAAE